MNDMENEDEEDDDDDDDDDMRDGRSDDDQVCESTMCVNTVTCMIY